MKTAIYIEQGVTQFVLTPESEIDRKVLTEMEQAGGNLKTFRGEFYGCQGGWIRWDDTMYNYGGDSSDRSLIFRIDKRHEHPA